MSQAGTVTWLAMRELWITFRLLIVLAAYVAAGAVVALVPAAPAESVQRLAAGLGVATVVAASLAAWSVAEERTSGRAGWLLTRSVSRGTYLLGWFAALSGVALVGVAAGAVLGWVALSAVALGLDGAEFVAVSAAAGTSSGAAVALGMLVGSVARAGIAAGIAAAACVAIGAVWLLLGGSAHGLVAAIAGPDDLVPDALRAAGIGLSLTAALLAATRLAVERAEL